MMARKVGFFHNGAKGSFQKHYAAFVGRMREVAKDQGVTIVERWARDATGKTPIEHVEDLVKDGVTVVAAAGGPPSAQAAKEATKNSKVPVVFTSVADPVGLGLVASLDKPGGNATGVAGLTSELDVVRLQILRELVAEIGGNKIGVLNNSQRPRLKEQYHALQVAGTAMGLTLVPKNVANLNEIDAAFKTLKDGEKVDAILVTADSLFNDLRGNVVKLARGVPAIYQWREFAEAGGLMSYGPSIIEAYEQVGEYVGRILNGEEPANLPVKQPDYFEFVINLKVAHADRVKIPAALMARAISSTADY